MATVPGSLVWKNNSFLAKEFGNGNQMAQFRKESNNIYNLNSFKYSGLANKKTVTVQPAGKDLGVVLATTKSKKQNKPAKLLHKSVMNKEFRIMATAVADQVETLLNSVKWDDKGLAVAIAQHVDTGAILMQGFANKEALATTISSRKATFYSRSRSSLWTKGETSNNFINVDDIFLDCDHDSIIYLGKPDGPTCHTGSETCYYFSVNDFLRHPEVKENRLALTTLYALESTISKREAEIESVGNGKPSWTKKLLLDQKLLCSKIREEADELCRTLEENEDKSRAASEAADVIFHSMVLLRKKDVKLEEVLQVLRQRFSQSGIDEKNSRK